MKEYIIKDEGVSVLELSPEKMIDAGFHLMTGAQVFTRCADGVRDLKDIQENMSNINEARISKYEGHYDVYVRLNEQGAVE